MPKTAVAVKPKKSWQTLVELKCHHFLVWLERILFQQIQAMEPLEVLDNFWIIGGSDGDWLNGSDWRNMPYNLSTLKLFCVERRLGYSDASQIPKGRELSLFSTWSCSSLQFKTVWALTNIGSAPRSRTNSRRTLIGSGLLLLLSVHFACNICRQKRPRYLLIA